jgi:hypothetical protein
LVCDRLVPGRRLERLFHDWLAFRFIAPNDHLNHDIIATFRRRFLPEIVSQFANVRLPACEMGVLRSG